MLQVSQVGIAIGVAFACNPTACVLSLDRIYASEEPDIWPFAEVGSNGRASCSHAIFSVLGSFLPASSTFG